MSDFEADPPPRDWSERSTPAPVHDGGRDGRAAGRVTPGGDAGQSGEVAATPAAAAAVFGEQLSRAENFVQILADTGISHGLIGPREAPRLWERHVLNCALVHYAIPEGERGQRVIDIGSGAGLPGVALAIARPDLEVHLVEPLSRRTGWLSGVAAQLDLENVVIHTARAESLWDRLSAPWATARAVSGILQLAQWSLPLLSPHGSLLALKGSRAPGELAENRVALERLGVVDAGIEVIGEGIVSDPTIVLRVTIGDSIDRRRFRTRAPSSAGSARRRADRPRGAHGPGSSPRDGGRRSR